MADNPAPAQPPTPPCHSTRAAEGQPEQPGLHLRAHSPVEASGGRGVSDLHRIRVECPDGRGVLTRVTMDGEELRGVVRVSWQVGVDGFAETTLTLLADTVLDGESEVIQQWRRERSEKRAEMIGPLASAIVREAVEKAEHEYERRERQG